MGKKKRQDARLFATIAALSAVSSTGKTFSDLEVVEIEIPELPEIGVQQIRIEKPTDRDPNLKWNKDITSGRVTFPKFINLSSLAYSNDGVLELRFKDSDDFKFRIKQENQRIMIQTSLAQCDLEELSDDDKKIAGRLLKPILEDLSQDKNILDETRKKFPNLKAAYEKSQYDSIASDSLFSKETAFASCQTEAVETRKATNPFEDPSKIITITTERYATAGEKGKIATNKKGGRVAIIQTCNEGSDDMLAGTYLVLEAKGGEPSETNLANVIGYDKNGIPAKGTFDGDKVLIEGETTDEDWRRVADQIIPGLGKLAKEGGEAGDMAEKFLKYGDKDGVGTYGIPAIRVSWVDLVENLDLTNLKDLPPERFENLRPTNIKIQGSLPRYFVESQEEFEPSELKNFFGKKEVGKVLSGTINNGKGGSELFGSVIEDNEEGSFTGVAWNPYLGRLEGLLKIKPDNGAVLYRHPKAQKFAYEALKRMGIVPEEIIPCLATVKDDTSQQSLPLARATLFQASNEGDSEDDSWWSYIRQPSFLIHSYLGSDSYLSSKQKLDIRIRTKKGLRKSTSKIRKGSSKRSSYRRSSRKKLSRKPAKPGETRGERNLVQSGAEPPATGATGGRRLAGLPGPQQSKETKKKSSGATDSRK
eukprot:GHVP01068791.1.p1 GENE.GHVP01068791.1~~GHVP01068791.1.p1  ORF type:complete len:647 (-),score=139.16 GHVP01068791.1:1884-3824(-)